MITLIVLFLALGLLFFVGSLRLKKQQSLPLNYTVCAPSASVIDPENKEEDLLAPPKVSLEVTSFLPLQDFPDLEGKENLLQELVPSAVELVQEAIAASEATANAEYVEKVKRKLMRKTLSALRAEVESRGIAYSPKDTKAILVASILEGGDF
jgi:hypothetical protein